MFIPITSFHHSRMTATLGFVLVITATNVYFQSVAIHNTFKVKCPVSDAKSVFSFI